MRGVGKFFAIAVVAALPAMSWATPVSANLVVNGDFEADNLGWSVFPTLTGIVTGPQYGISGPQSGLRWLVLGDPIGGSFSQAIAGTVAGQSLTLDYWLAGTGDDPSAFSAAWNGQEILGSAVSNFNSGGAFQNFQFQVLATGSDVLSFYGKDLPNFMGLDNVSLVADLAPIPEPGTFGLAATVLVLGFGAFRRRRSVAKGGGAIDSGSAASG